MEVIGHLSHFIRAEWMLSDGSPRGSIWRYAEVLDIVDEVLGVCWGFG
jgi:hypothetical protein